MLAHGALMQVMWISSSWGLWLREMFRWQIAHSVCNLAGVIAWLALTGMAFALMPVVRRTYYWVRRLIACVVMQRGRAKCCVFMLITGSQCALPWLKL